jgi:hypothetical protein
MARFNLEDYDTVASRIAKFWEKYPEGRIKTQVLKREANDDPNVIKIKAYGYRNITDTKPFSTGIAEETKDSSPVNKTSWVENAETSAIGRMLANGGFAAVNSRPSREEMEKVQRLTEKTVNPAQVEAAKAFIEQIFDAKTVGGLRKLYDTIPPDLLTVNVDGVTAKIATSRQKAILEEN